MAGFERVQIMIVDDQPNCRKLLVSILGGFGFRGIVQAASGKDALLKMQHTVPDAIFTDLRMEDMDGFELIQRIRNRDNSPNPFVPIIVISGSSDRHTILKVRDLGANEFLAKPFSVESIMSRLSMVIHRPRPFVQAKTFFGPDRRRLRRDEYQGAERRAA